MVAQREAGLLHKGCIAIALSIVLGGCSGDTQPVATDAWVRLPAIPGRPAAAYATLTGGATDAEVTAITTPAAARTELHRSMAGMNGMASMHPVDRLPLPAGQSISLAPGGMHVMLFDLAGGLRPGGRTTIAFRLGNGAQVTTPARLVGPGDPAPF